MEAIERWFKNRTRASRHVDAVPGPSSPRRFSRFSSIPVSRIEVSRPLQIEPVEPYLSHSPETAAAVQYQHNPRRDGKVFEGHTEPDAVSVLNGDSDSFKTPNHIGHPYLVNGSRDMNETLDEGEDHSLAAFNSYVPTFSSPGLSASGIPPTRGFSNASAKIFDAELWIKQKKGLIHKYERPLPRWYIQNPGVTHKSDSSYLCATCRHIDLEYIFKHQTSPKSASPEEYIGLGPLSGILGKSQCSLCRLIGAIIRSDRESRHLKPNRKSTVTGERIQEPGELYLDSMWYLAPNVYTCEEYGSGYQVFLRRDILNESNDISFKTILAATAPLSPSYPLGIRLVVDEKRGGRIVPRNQIDFAWVKRCLELCEINSETPKRDFNHIIRAINTIDLCIVDLGDDARYVALSYPWGGTKQVTLTRETETLYYQPNSLSLLFNELPKTIRDAIILVSKLGERYLWVDSLCIFQDDEEDVEQQLMQMGEIYRGSILTVHAVSGEDAAHGLSGVCEGTRNITQLVAQVRRLTITNLLPWMEETELTGAWSTRAWTFQERALSQRHLMVADDGVIFNCWHTYTAEDEHCRHARRKLPRSSGAVASGQTLFWAGQDKRCKPYIRYRTPFDTYAMLISDYTPRQLTFQTDAAKAFQGVLSWLKQNFGRQFIHGLPETELDAALLWSPIGSCMRRRDSENGNYLFPSWSWLGWIGHSAYPWTLEREYFMSTAHSPMVWQNKNAAHPEPRWFTFEDLCFPPSAYRDGTLAQMRAVQEDHLGVRQACDSAQTWPMLQQSLRWVADQWPKMKYAVEGSHQLCFRTLSAKFRLLDTVYQREKLYNMQHKIFRLRICDNENYTVGYIDIPDPRKQLVGENIRNGISPGVHEFIVLSRSTMRDFNPAPGPLEKRPRPKRYSQEEIGSKVSPRPNSMAYVSEKGCFDDRAYDDKRPWCLFNVMMIKRKGDVAYRSAIGRIHVDAFLYANATEEVIKLE